MFHSIKSTSEYKASNRNGNLPSNNRNTQSNNSPQDTEEKKSEILYSTDLDRLALPTNPHLRQIPNTRTRLDNKPFFNYNYTWINPVTGKKTIPRCQDQVNLIVT